MWGRPLDSTWSHHRRKHKVVRDQSLCSPLQASCSLLEPKCQPFYFFFLLIFIGGQLAPLYYVSIVEQSGVNLTYTYISSLLDFLPIQVITEHRVGSLSYQSRFSLTIYFIHSINRVYMSIPISQFILPLFFSLLGVYMFVLHVCVSISALQIHLFVPFFWTPHICINI